MRRKDWDFGEFIAGGFGPMFRGPRHFYRGPRARRWGRWFEPGEMRLVILRLIREKPRHGYEIIKALEEQFHGCYTPSAGSVYPTLQMLEDQGYVRIVEEGGKKVYHITPEGEAFLDENKDLLSEIGERIRDAMHGVAGGNVGEVNAAFATLAKRVFKDAWRNGPDSERTAKIAEILRRATADIEALCSRALSRRRQESRAILRRVDPELLLERAPKRVGATEADRCRDALDSARARMQPPPRLVEPQAAHEHSGRTAEVDVALPAELARRHRHLVRERVDAQIARRDSP